MRTLTNILLGIIALAVAPFIVIPLLLLVAITSPVWLPLYLIGGLAKAAQPKPQMIIRVQKSGDMIVEEESPYWIDRLLPRRKA
jgi:hypothetical protein